MARDATDLARRSDVERLLAHIATLEQLLEVYERTTLQQSKRLERSGEYLSYVADASTALTASLQPDTVLDRFAHLLVPALADWCAIDVVEDDGSMRRLSVAYADESKADVAAIVARQTIDPNADTPAMQALRSRKSMLVAEVPKELIEAAATTPEHRRAAEAIAPRSLMIAPLVARGRAIGVVSVATAESGRIYSRDDLRMFEDLAARAALAVDNARLFQDVQAAERRYRDLIEGLDAIVWEADAHTGAIAFITHRAQEVFGHAPQRWTESPTFWLSVIHPDDRQVVLETRREMLAAARNHDLEYRGITADGRVVWLRDVVHVIADDAGRAVRMRGVTVDITDRKLIERRTAAQHAVTAILADARTLAEAAPRILESIATQMGWDLALFWVPDPTGRMLVCLDDWSGPDLRGFVSQSRMTPLKRGIGLPGEVWENGRAVWVEDVQKRANFLRRASAAEDGLHGAVAFPVVAGGDVLGVMEFIAREPRETDTAMIEMMATVGAHIGQFIERRRAEEGLRISEGRKGAILESSIDSVITMDVGGTILEFNPAAEQTFGYKREEAVGRPLSEVIVPPQYREAHERGLERFRSTGAAPVLGKRLELIGMRADGTEFPVELTITRIDLPGPPMFTGVLRDITDRKAAERALRESRERAAFLADASRQLATSLDYTTTIDTLARVAVPYLADVCLVDALETEGTLVRAASADTGEAMHDLASAIPIGRRTRIDPSAEHGPARVITSGAPESSIEVPDEILIAEARGDARYLELLRAAKLTGYLCVPLSTRGRTIGAVTFLTGPGGRRFTAEDVALAEELAVRAAMAIDHARLYQDSEHIARVLQESLLPPSLPAIAGLEVGARYAPAGDHNQVGGDFYDVFHTGPGRWAFVIGDVCGKGADAAALTALARYTVRAAAMQTAAPSEILMMLNNAILRQQPDGRFCTMAFSTVHIAKDGAEVQVACGGHPSPYVLRADGRIETIEAPGTLVGVFPDPEYTDRTVSLQPGDSVILFTDGVTEARKGDTFLGGPELESVLLACTGLSADEIAGRIEEAASSFQDGRTRDDIAILVLKVNGE